MGSVQQQPSLPGRQAVRGWLTRSRRLVANAPLPVQVLAVALACVCAPPLIAIGLLAALVFAPYALWTGDRSRFASLSVAVWGIAFTAALAHGPDGPRYLLLLLAPVVSVVARIGAAGRSPGAMPHRGAGAGLVAADRHRDVSPVAHAALVRARGRLADRARGIWLAARQSAPGQPGAGSNVLRRGRARGSLRDGYRGIRRPGGRAARRGGSSSSGGGAASLPSGPAAGLASGPAAGLASGPAAGGQASGHGGRAAPARIRSAPPRPPVACGAWTATEASKAAPPRRSPTGR